MAGGEMCVEVERYGWWAFIHCSLLCCVVLMVYSVIDFPAFSSMFVVEIDCFLSMFARSLNS